MSTLGQNTGIGCYTSLEEKVRNGLSRCKTNNPINCGNCPYVFLKDDEAQNVDHCTTALAGDAEELIDGLIGNKIVVFGVMY